VTSLLPLRRHRRPRAGAVADVRYGGSDGCSSALGPGEYLPTAWTRRRNCASCLCGQGLSWFLHELPCAREG